MTHETQSKTASVLLGILLAITVLALIGAGIYIYRQHKTLTYRESQLASTTAKLAEATSTIARLEEANRNLRSELEDRTETVEHLREQVEDITGEVSTIQKRQELDPELLKKYSKVYFLNENYWPSGLEKIDDEWIAEANDEESDHFHEKAYPFLEDMLEDAEDDDIELRIISAFRSFSEQASLKSHYNVTYGEESANQFSAAQGYSEHQLGTTVDFTTPELDTNFERFDQTEAFEWLTDNAHEYGFVLSYPEGNQHYQFEPWHWRFVGVELAEEIEDEGTIFYEMDQREIDEYLVEIFDR